MPSAEEPTEKPSQRPVPKAAAFAAFPLFDGSISLLGEESSPAGQSSNETIGSVQESSFLGGQPKFRPGAEVESPAPIVESKIAAPIYELQSLLTREKEKREESAKPELEGEKLPEDYKMSREGLQMRIRILEDELNELRESVGTLKKRDAKTKAFLDYVNVLGSYYMKNCKYYDREGWCTNWFWNNRPNFENPDGSKVATRRGEDGKYYIKPNVLICSLCNAATSKFWV